MVRRGPLLDKIIEILLGWLGQAVVITNKIEQGATWRRWDLHVHTPESVIGSRSATNSYYGNWDEYLDVLEQKALHHNISVIGVTDYWSIEGYKRLFKEKKAGRLSSVDLLIPNIECRFALQTQAGKSFNIHLLIDPTPKPNEADDAHIKEIEAALKHLRFEVEKGKKFSCTQDDLRSLGEFMESSPTDAKGRLKLGTEQFKPSHDVFLKWLDNEAGQWLKSRTLLAVANGSDGITGLTQSSGLTALQGRLQQWADLVFSGSDRDREHYLQLPKPKPCIHGCDAQAVFEPVDQKYCWIKSDPTFVGFRQILREPQERIWIGSTKPGPTDPAKIIERVSLSGNAWFETTDITLNSALVAVVGEKGAGKTAIGELIARAAGVKISELRSGNHSQTFVGRAGKSLNGLSVTLGWGDGSKTSFKVGDDSMSLTERVRYLSQDFVERLCSEDHSGDSLVSELEKMVFNHLPVEKRLQCATFSELRNKHTAAMVTRKVDLQDEIKILNEKIDNAEKEIESKHRLEAETAELQVEIVRLKLLLEEAQSSINPTALARLEKAATINQKLESELSELNEQRSQLKNAFEAYELFKRRTFIAFSELETQLIRAGIDQESIATFKPSFQGSVVLVFAKLLEKVEANITALGATSSDDGDGLTPGTRSDAALELAAAQQEVSIDMQVKAKVLKLREQISDNEQRAGSGQKRLERLTAIELDIAEQKERRLECYRKVLKTLQDEAEVLKVLYSPLTQQIAERLAETETEEFSVGVRPRSNWKGWLEKCPDFFDRRKPSNVNLTDERVKQLNEALLTDETGNELIAVIKTLDAELGSREEMEQRLRTGFKTQDVSDWLFDTTGISVSYVLEYGGVELSHQSPGTRGIVLLLLYLLVDDKDNRPLIIDQPEGNLDNSSVAKALVPFIRTSKRERQIIIVSHNPNLVVVTDAEQIIISTATRPTGLDHPVLSYSGGAFEAIEGESSPHEETIRILEGGRAPFGQRTEGYKISNR